MTSLLKNKFLKSSLFVIFIFFVYVLLTLFIFRNKIPTLFSHYGMPDVDTDGGLWFQWYLTYIKSQGTPYDLLNIVGFPFGYDIAFSPITNLVYSIQAFIMSAIGFSWKILVTITNISSLLVYPLSAIGAFFLSHYLTKDKLASFISGIVFGFSYYVIYMGRGQMSINHIELVPFYLLSLFYFLDNKKLYSLSLSVVLFSILFKTDAYYAFFSGILSVLIVIFYKQENIKKIIKTFFIYYLFLFLTLIVTNLNFFYTNLYLFNSVEIVKTGRNSLPKNELLPLKTYFDTLPSSWISFLLSRYSIFLGIIPILVSFLGFFVVNNKKVFSIAAICLFLCVVLTSYSPIFYWINILYFDYFGMFRGVSRMIMPAYLFIGIMSGMVISALYKNEKLKKIHPKLPVTIAVLFIISYISCSLVKDPTWYRKTDYSQIANLYQPIKDNNDINVIAAYPMRLGAGTYGFPQTYELLGQTIHNKKLASGVSPFSPELKSYNTKINNISDTNTIPNLTKYGIDTIIIYNNLMKDSETINASLSSDTRLSFVGHYQAEQDLGYSSSLEGSKNISVYQINDVVNNNQNYLPLIYSTDTEAKVEYVKVSPYKYLVTIIGKNQDENIIFNYPYSDKWQIIEGDFSKTPDCLIKNENPDIQNTHFRHTEFANGWSIKNQYPGKTIVITLLFKPHGQYELSDLIGYFAFFVLGVFSLLPLLLRKNETI